MEELALEAAKVEVLSDLIKIGIPALAGLVSGLSVSLISFYVEKQRFNNTKLQADINYKREKITELVDALSNFSGHLFYYITTQEYTSRYSDANSEELVYKGGQELLSNEYQLKKARAIANLIGEKAISESLDEFDQKATEVIRWIVEKWPSQNPKSVGELKEIERRVFSELSNILNSRK